MTTKEWASLLNGREYGEEISREERHAAKDDGIVIVHGASDNLMEFCGAIDEEVSAYGGQEVWLTSEGFFEECQAEDGPCVHCIRARRATARAVEAIWTEDRPELMDEAHRAAWLIRTDIPHETFRIMEDGDLFCIGVVFALDDVKVTPL